MSDFSKLAINQFTTLHQWSLPQAIEGYARNGVHAIGIVRDKLQEVGAAEARRLLRAHGMTVSCYCIGGLLTDSDPGRFQANLAETRRAIDEAAELEADCIVFVGRWAAGGIEGSGRRPRALPGGLGRSTAPCERGGDYARTGTLAPNDMCVPLLPVDFGPGKRMD